MSSWCDKLASVPAAGFRMSSHHFATSTRILDCLAPILDRHVDDGQTAFSVDLPGEYSVNVKTNSGFAIGVDSERVHVTFHHMMRPKAVSGGPPIMEMLSTPLPYTKLLPEVVERLIDATLLVPNTDGRGVNRMGIMTVTHVSEDELPPGIEKLISHFGAPWSQGLSAYTFQVCAVLDTSQNYEDRCVYTVLKSEKKKDLLNVQFDYQRIFDDFRSVDRDVLNKDMHALSHEALKHFEKIAVGDMFDASSFVGPND